MTSTPGGVRSCAACIRNDLFDPGFSMAFQPIVDVQARTVFAYEALVRGRQGEPAAHIMSQVTAANRYRFDQDCRTTAINLATRLGLADAHLSINFMPNAVYQPDNCLRSTIQVALTRNLPLDRLIFEMSEDELSDRSHVHTILRTYQRRGLKTAIDDFGSGYSGLNLLAEFQPDFVKIDMHLVRNVHTDRARQAIIRATLALCHDLGITAIAEGVETADELAFLTDAGVRLVQGYLIARPGFETLPQPELPITHQLPA